MAIFVVSFDPCWLYDEIWQKRQPSTANNLTVALVSLLQFEDTPKPLPITHFCVSTQRDPYEPPRFHTN
jgi:hypothetical protein